VAACSKVRDKVTKEPLYELHIKPKVLEHFDLFLKDPDISQLISETGISINLHEAARHDVKRAIQDADKVVSIGFTTPGIDTMALGMMSIYFTPYRGIYNSIFDSDNSPLVAHDEKELRSFILCDKPMDHNDLSQHVYRPGEMVGPRFVDALLELLD
jgi:hypothetical protein